ncbi:Glycosyl transferases group 1 [Legionella nautarum]|uniref:Glycosyl transferases group 1 n=1 Tax=Legionella nautarum TaxID=45070 RepID=A0A0W0WW49_9GAMM|nr:glycosyltransferase family 4 protein [Legionella nautarum]KTD36484.1 Glycosyl transferases group 1 [Legionella nautarum]
MKLILFTPVLKSSAIGRMASLISRKLISFGHQVIVVRTEDLSFYNHPIHDFGSEPISWCDNHQINLMYKSADAVIYQIGDNYAFHQGCLTWLPYLPGVVCLHDFFLGNLFNAWAQHHRAEAKNILKIWYGSAASDEYFRHKDINSFIEGTRNSYPMTEWLCSMARAVITHSSWQIGRVLDSCPGPVHVVPLAYDAPNLSIEQIEAAEEKSKKFSILTVGNVNKNKRAASIIQAIGANRVLRKKIIYQLVGDISSATKRELTRLAKKQKVELVISGEVDDAALAQAIYKADLVTCLRWPALEAASASTIEALLYGKATIVTDTGFYREIPKDCTIKINPNNEIAEIAAVLEKLEKNPELLKELGLQAKKWAMKTFTADNYALKLIETIVTTSRTNVVTNAVNYFTKVMYDWGAKNELLGKEYILPPLAIFDEIT